MAIFGQQNKPGFGDWFEKKQHDEAGVGGDGGESQDGLLGTWAE